MSHRVYVVGIGMVTAGGLNLDHTWQSVMKGEVCAGTMPLEIEQYVKPVVCYPVRGPRIGVIGMAEKAAGEALWDAGNLVPDSLFLGSTSAGFQQAASWALEDFSRGRSPVNLPASDDIALSLADSLNLSPARAFQFSSACSASSSAISQAYDEVRNGYSGVALAGGADELSAPVVWMFDRTRVYAPYLKPFDEDRRGVVLADGAAFLVLCNESILATGGMRTYCEIVNTAMNCDAYDAAAPDWVGISSCIGETMKPFSGDIDFICAHGTGTKLNDRAEAQAINDRFGQTRPYVASYKGSLGHPQGASGAVGVALTAKAIAERFIFPTAGLEIQDPEIHLNLPRTGFSARIDTALVMSYGSWGANVGIALRRP